LQSLAAVLATGCVTVVKPSEYTPLTTLKLGDLYRSRLPRLDVAERRKPDRHRSSKPSWC